jgi:hypothetical protein
VNRIQYKSSTPTGEREMKRAQNKSRRPLRATALFKSGEDRIRTCGPGYPGHRFSKPAHSTTLPPLLRLELFLARSSCSPRRNGEQRNPVRKSEIPFESLLFRIAPRPASRNKYVSPIQRVQRFIFSWRPRIAALDHRPAAALPVPRNPRLAPSRHRRSRGKPPSRLIGPGS